MKRIGVTLGGIALVTAGLVAMPTAAFAAPGDVQVDNGGTVTEHATLSGAFAAALDGATITLTDDEVVTDEVILVDREITLNLGGFDIDFTRVSSATRIDVQGGDLNIIGSGELRETVLDQFAPIILRGNASPTDTSRVTVGADVVLTGWAGLFLNNTAGSNNGMVAEIYGTLQTNFPATGTGLYVNGTITEATAAVIPVINVHPGAVIGVVGPTGMYLAGSTTTTITGATVTGTSVGIEVRAGYVTLNDSTVTGGSGTPESNPSGSGSSSTNSALAIVQQTTNQPLEVTVNGGTFTGGAAVQVANPEVTNPAMAGVEVSITGGIFDGPVVSTNVQPGNDPLTAFVSGGVFSDGIDPALVSADMAILVSEGTTESSVLAPDDAREQAAASAQVNGRTVYFVSVDDARAAADDGTEITVFPRELPPTGVELDASGLLLGGLLLTAGAAMFVLRRRVAAARH